ncbi:MAG: isomerizing glutamine--fructose-6-phosphate transaminase, partial [Clostridia bacterium]|nr:isomerizing glutamine--fructose-6-phosphate transaminase [Clostridia bacterium]
IEKLTRIPVKVEVASEFRYSDPLVDAQTLTVVISQSGETADTLAAMREAQARGSKAIAITNVVDSTIAREADSALYTWAGPEIAVASTKAYTTQLMLMYLLGIYLAQQKGHKNPELLQELRQISEKVALILKDSSHIQDFVERYAHIKDTFFIGRGLDQVVAQEGSLKLKEISYIHAEAYAAGELKHGTLALIVEDVLVIALVTQQALYDKTLSNIKEVKAREASVLALAQEGHQEVEKVVDEVIYIPAANSLLTPILAVIPLQLLAYYMAVAKGSDVDQPRNLAKSVTVE